MQEQASLQVFKDDEEEGWKEIFQREYSWCDWNLQASKIGNWRTEKHMKNMESLFRHQVRDYICLNIFKTMIIVILFFTTLFILLLFIYLLRVRYRTPNLSFEWPGRLACQMANIVYGISRKEIGEGFFHHLYCLCLSISAIMPLLLLTEIVKYFQIYSILCLSQYDYNPQLHIN